MTPRYLVTLFAAVGVLASGLPAQALAKQTVPTDGVMHPYRPRVAPVEGDISARPLTTDDAENLAALARLLAYVRYFHPSDASADADWTDLTLAGVQRIEGARGPSDLAARLRALLASVAPEIPIFENDAPLAAPDLPQAEQYLLWRHLGVGTGAGNTYRSERVTIGYRPQPHRVDLGAGVSAWLPMAAAVGSQSAAAPPLEPDKPQGFIPSGFDRDTRLAAVIVAWGAMEHFFPYFDVVQADWDGHLLRTLQRAALDNTDLEFRDTLRSLLVPLEDGHVTVRYPVEPLGRLPLAVDWIEDQVVITGVGATAEGLAVGDVILGIGGVAVADLIAQEEALSSAAPHRRRHLAVQAMLIGRRNETTVVDLVTGRGEAVERSLTFEVSPTALTPARPDRVTTLGDGMVYVDLSRISGEALLDHAQLLSGASGIVFDLRGYPSGSVWYLGHLTDQTIHSPHFDRPILTTPGETHYQAGAWTIQPAQPRFTSNVAFITDESAISFSESILGTVEDNRLADIVGEPTAGANGNINRMPLPGGYMITWTGMRVTKGDGARHHGVGVQPTIPVEPTIAGIRAGRDELLERAIDLVRSRLP